MTLSAKEAPFDMAYNAGWFTAAAHTDKWVSTARLTIQVLEPAEKTLMGSQGKLVRAGRPISAVTMEVRSQGRAP